jgi:phosphoenolpyruvate synthase/pyruvate phosphate dikinase
MPAKLPPPLEKRLDGHGKKYGWMKWVLGMTFDPVGRDEYERRIKVLLSDADTLDIKIKRIQNTRAETERAYRETIKKHNIKGELLSLCEAVRNFIHIRTRTTGASDRFFATARQTLFPHLAKTLKMKTEDALTLNTNEIAALLSGGAKTMRDTIRERRDGFAIIWLNGKVETIFGADANTLQTEVTKLYRTNDGGAAADEKCGQIYGRTANRGKVVGTVKVLRSHRDVDKLKPGEILVAGMTAPEFVPAMEKAGGFITDEGGMTCHAAIISREFDVPCIVGTNCATSILKDGDTVELNADTGTIKILTPTPCP